MEAKQGKLITFYSYKGGTGRSMALANVACLLARQRGNSILAIDWDLEAPGLHEFFRRTESRPTNAAIDKLKRSRGTIELLHDLALKIGRDKSERPLSEEAVQKIIASIELTDFIWGTAVQGVDLMPAGRFDNNYEKLVHEFDWRTLFDKGPTLFRQLAERFIDKYDYVLVDSRTGLNDISGICTSLLPDQLVLVFTPNRQSLHGGISVVRKATEYRRQSDDIRPLGVFLLPSRIDLSEPRLLDRWRFGHRLNGDDDPGYQRQFEALFEEVYGLPSCDLKNYFDEVQIQHVPRYSYGEEIAAETERGTRLSLSRSYAAFADVLAKHENPWTVSPSVEAGAELVSGASPTAVKVEAAKAYLAEERFKVKLHDLVTEEVRAVLSHRADFGIQGDWSENEFAVRLQRYEEICNDLLLIQALLGFWGGATHRKTLTLSPRRVCSGLKRESGLVAWIDLRRYPALLLFYAGGIAAVAADRYDNLLNLMLIPVSDEKSKKDPSLIRSLARVMNSLDKPFKSLPGHKKQYTPINEYLYGFFQPPFEDLFSLGPEYEPVFDRFEVLFALQHAYKETADGRETVWGPVGRFGWKFRRDGEDNPFHEIVEEANAKGTMWPPVQAGLFGGSVDQFKQVADNYRQSLVGLPWY